MTIPGSDYGPRDWENRVVLSLVDAMLENVGRNVRGVTVETTFEHVTVYFAMGAISAVDEEDIEDIVGELDALLDGHTRITTDVQVTAIDASWAGSGHRWVYKARPDSP